MKKHFLSFLYLSLAAVASGQPLMKLRETEHNFGTFNESAGRQSFTFQVVNSGNEPLVIQNIVASCGCTTPEWTRTPIAPGGEGKIIAVYEPADRPGPFSKTLSVFSNSKPSPLLLTLMGEVKGKVKTAEDYYPWQVGSVRFQGNSIAFPEVKNTEKRIRVLRVINLSGSPVRVEFEGVPPYIELKSIPAVLKAGGNGIIECIYYGKKAGKWGYISDTTKVRLDGKVQQSEFLIQAVITEDFSRLSKSDLEEAPLFRRTSTRIDLGNLEAGTTKDVEFLFSNDGKHDLIIRSIWGSGSCFSFKAENNSVIQPGKSGRIALLFDTGKLSGKVSRTFYVFTNDPASPKVAFTVESNVIPAKKTR